MKRTATKLFLLTAVALLLTLAGAPGTPLGVAPAQASSQSIVTIGVGTDLGVNHHLPTEGGSSRSFISELSLRLRLVHFLGFSFAYNLAPASRTGELVFTSTYRMTALVYVVPTEKVSFYLSGGFGALKIQDLGTVTGSTNTYHAGAGLEFYIGDHIALHIEYLWMIPGVSSIKGSVERRATQEVGDTVADSVASGAIPGSIDLPSISASDYLSPENFQINFGFRWYL